MKTKYVIKHEHNKGVTHYYVTTNASFEEIQDIVDGWDEQGVYSQDCLDFCKALDIPFNAWKGDFLSVEIYEEPTSFIDLDELLNNGEQNSD